MIFNGFINSRLFLFSMVDLKKKHTKYRIESTIFHIYFLALLFIMLLRYKSIKNLPDIFIYGATIILILHIWWGAFFIVKYHKLQDSLILFFLNLIMLIVLFFVPFVIKTKELWALIFSLFFALAIIEYSVLYDKTSKNSIRRYIKKKISYEILAPLLFLLLYVLFKFFKSGLLFLILCIAVFAGQIFFVIFLSRIKKVYKIIKA